MFRLHPVEGATDGGVEEFVSKNVTQSLRSAPWLNASAVVSITQREFGLLATFESEGFVSTTQAELVLVATCVPRWLTRSSPGRVAILSGNEECLEVSPEGHPPLHSRAGALVHREYEERVGSGSSAG